MDAEEDEVRGQHLFRVFVFPFLYVFYYVSAGRKLDCLYNVFTWMPRAELDELGWSRLIVAILDESD